MEIRDARPEDCPALTRLARAAKASWGYPAPWLEEWAPQLEIRPEYLEHHIVLVADLVGRPVGFASLETSGNTTGEVGHLWVDPHHQGQGHGAALMNALVERAVDTGLERLQIVSDPNAVGFYAGFGAVQVGEEDAPVQGTPRTLPVLSVSLERPTGSGSVDQV